MEAQNVNTSAQNVNTPAQNVNTSAQNVNTVDEDTPLSCPNCTKTFERQYHLDRHIQSCKGDLHPYECYKCHAILSCRASKSRHVKHCKVEPQQVPTTIINNTTNNTNSHNTTNINTTNNYTQLLNQNNNYNILNYGQEDKSHLTHDFLNSAAGMKHGFGILKCIEAIHFNEDKPQNHNMRFIEGRKQTDIAVRRDDKWYATDHMRVLPRLLGSTKSFLLDFVNSIRDKIDPTDYILITNSLQEGVDWIKNPQQFYNIKRQIFIAMEKLSKILEEDVIDKPIF